MTQGVIYYNRGTKCLIRLAVSIYSLRKVYRGEIELFHEGDGPLEWFQNFIDSMGVSIAHIPDAPAALVQKSRLWKWADLDTSLFIDADTLVLEDPTPLFAEIEKTGFAVTRFADWVSTGKKIGGRIRCWKDMVSPKVIDDALAYGAAINTGVFGFHRDHPLLPAWDELTTKGHKFPREIMSRTLDETACQVLCGQYLVTLMDQRWNYSINYGVGKRISILHMHGGKSVMPENAHCHLWKDVYWEMRNKKLLPDETFGDKRLADYLYHGSRKYKAPGVLQKAKDLTLVTAADPNYVARLTRNFARWMKIPSLALQDFIVFAINADENHPAYAELRKHPNVRILPWKFDAPTMREIAFSAFVFGTAKHVTTDYWMKIDGDTEPTELGRLDWPSYRAYTITADPWGFTRTKGDPDATSHFLNRLDAWWGGEPMFPANIPTFSRYGHPRLRSFAWIEKTEFTRKLAARCGARLPIPSHDGTSWYVATRMDEPIQAYKFRRFIRA